MKDNTRKFLEELSELSKKYGIAIDGCGCCGSPYLFPCGDGAYVVDEEEKNLLYRAAREGEK